MTRRSPLGGRRPTKADLPDFIGQGVDEVIGDEVRLLIVGINPGLWTAAANAPFAHPGNRFWPALHGAGLTPVRVDASAGLSEADEKALYARGIGLTNLVARATARADELTAGELIAGRHRLERLVAQLEPGIVVIVGITAYRTAFGDRSAKLGRQEHDLGTAELWVLPQPSGLNAHAPLPVLIDWWRKIAAISA